MGAEYRWLPAPRRALARLLSAEAVRPLGQFADARRELEAAMAECDEALGVLGVLPEGGNAIAAREAEDAALAEAAGGRRRCRHRGGGERAPRTRRPLPSRRGGIGGGPVLRTGADASPYLAIRLLTLRALVGMDLTACKSRTGEPSGVRAMVEAALDARQQRLQRTLLRGRCCTAGAPRRGGDAVRGGGGDGEAWYPATRDLACVCGALTGLGRFAAKGVAR